jgi:predicted phage terminase large subunit-like protein
VALDPSKGTESKFGDYSAFVKVMYANDHCYYIDADLAQRNCSIMIDTALEIQREFLPDWFGVEVNQFQQLLADDLWAKTDSMRLPVPLWTINNTINKEVRIRRLTPWLSRKTMRFKANSRGAQLLVEQLRDFPLADHDDGPDALEMAMRLICEWPTELVIEDNQYLLP